MDKTAGGGQLSRPGQNLDLLAQKHIIPAQNLVLLEQKHVDPEQNLVILEQKHGGDLEDVFRRQWPAASRRRRPERTSGT